MTDQEKIKAFHDAKNKFEENLRLFDAAFGKDTAQYNICREVGLSLFKEEIGALLRSR